MPLQGEALTENNISLRPVVVYHALHHSLDLAIIQIIRVDLGAVSILVRDFALDSLHR